MAGDWMMMRLDLDEDPAVLLIAGITKLDPLDVVGRLWRVWAWANRQSRDGNARGVTKTYVDRVVGVTGFAQAMIEAGWLEEIQPQSDEDFGGIRIPKFDSWNSKSAKNRGLGSERAKAKRERDASRKRNAHSVTPALPEKRREEKRIKAPLPPVEIENTKTPKPPPDSMTQEEWESTPVGCARLWFLHRKGHPGPSEPMEKIVEEFEEQARLGVPLKILAERIKDPKRDHCEKWHIFRRENIEKPGSECRRAVVAAQERARIDEIEKRQYEARKEREAREKAERAVSEASGVDPSYNAISLRIAARRGMTSYGINPPFTAEELAEKLERRAGGSGGGDTVAGGTGTLPLSSTG